MAAIDYNELLTVARELIADAGRVVTFEYLVATAPDANKPWKPVQPGSPVRVDAPAAFVPPSGFEFGRKAMDDKLFRRAEQVCLVAPDASNDLTGAQIIIDGTDRFRVEWFWELKPGPLSVLYAFGICK